MEAPASQGASRAPYAQDRLLFQWDFLQAELLAKAPTVKKIEETTVGSQGRTQDILTQAQIYRDSLTHIVQ